MKNLFTQSLSRLVASLSLSILLLCAASQASFAQFAKGVDIGWLSQMEASGRKFYNNSGTQQDLLDILKGKGINSIRLRV